MKNSRRIFALLTFLACIALTAYSLGLETPVVTKVEPPNWWAHFTPELTLLLTGSNLSGARVESRARNLQVLGVHSSSNGHYLFVRMKTSASLAPGTVELHVRTESGDTTVRLPIAERADARGRFEGVSKDDVIYLIMPDRFADGDPSNDRPAESTGVCDRTNPMAYHGGDLRGVRQHLQYLHDLGVTAIWMTPVWKNTDSDYHGYHVVDFYAIDDHMGTMADYQALVADAHALGMKVLMDYVANHTGPKHVWAGDSPTPTWLHGTPAHHLDPAYTFNGIVDPHASPRESRATVEGWFAGKLPDLNPDDPELGIYLAQNAMWWAETAQLDGFRLDTFPYSSRKFWAGWHERLREVYPHINSIGEVADPDPTIASFFQGGRKQFDGVDSGLPTLFDFPLASAIRDVVIKGQPVQKIIDILQRDELYPRPEWLVTFIGNHDQTRFISDPGSSEAKLRAAFGLLLTMRGIPQIYSGDEIGMPGGADPDNRHDFPGGFPGDAHDAFTQAGRTPEQQAVFAYVRSLLALRLQHEALRTGKQWHIGWDDSYYAFLRETQAEKLLVLYNNATSERALKIPVGDTALQDAHQLQTLFGEVQGSILEGEVRVTMPPQSLVVFQVR